MKVAFQHKLLNFDVRNFKNYFFKSNNAFNKPKPNFRWFQMEHKISKDKTE